MSVLIKGMEMPMCCDDCPVFDDNGDYPTCVLTGLSKGYNFPIFEERMDTCPLVPIPTPHGRLIDANKLLKKGITLSWSVQKWVSEVDIGLMPTIIEAEEEEKCEDV